MARTRTALEAIKGSDSCRALKRDMDLGERLSSTFLSPHSAFSSFFLPLLHDDLS
jgi:hypothetical protein